MLDTDDTKVEFPPIITGAIYEAKRLGQGTEQMVCLARLETETGRIQGLFRRYGLTFERFDEKAEELAAWKMIWSPNQETVPAPRKKGRPSKKAAEAK
tara:strand:- start:235 stop:528 length:294 start_codon:yes stop_codon:yes gene_type:complete